MVSLFRKLFFERGPGFAYSKLSSSYHPFLMNLLKRGWQCDSSCFGDGFINSILCSFPPARYPFVDRVILNFILFGHPFFLVLSGLMSLFFFDILVSDILSTCHHGYGFDQFLVYRIGFLLSSLFLYKNSID